MFPVAPPPSGAASRISLGDANDNAAQAVSPQAPVTLRNRYTPTRDGRCRVAAHFPRPRRCSHPSPSAGNFRARDTGPNGAVRGSPGCGLAASSHHISPSARLASPRLRVPYPRRAASASQGEARPSRQGNTRGSVRRPIARWRSCPTGHPEARQRTALPVLALSPDGAVLAQAGPDQTVRLWDVASGRELSHLPRHTDGVAALAFSPDGKALATCDRQDPPRIWDTATGRSLTQCATGATGPMPPASPSRPTASSLQPAATAGRSWRGPRPRGAPPVVLRNGGWGASSRSPSPPTARRWLRGTASSVAGM